MPRFTNIAGAEVARDKDFVSNGLYNVWVGQELIAAIYRDPENREWYEQTGEHYSQSWLGSTKTEAVERVMKRYHAKGPGRNLGNR